MQPAMSPTTFTNPGGIEEGLQSDPTALLVLDSLFPVVKSLPNLIRENKSGHYYVSGKIEPSDLETLHNYAGRIGELTLGAELLDSEFRLAPHVLARIARLQDPNKPLFPNLHRLRIVATSPSSHFLDLLLSSSLTTLELTEIAIDPCYPSVLSLLECAIHQAPNLSTLILGPGRIQDRILDISSGYKNLRCLKLLDVEISITDQRLRDIGSLQHLDTFVLRDNSRSTYTRPPASSNPSIDAISPISQDQTSAAADGRDGDIPPILDTGEQTTHSALFTTLRTLEVDGTFDLIEDLVARVSSTNLRVLSIDITKPLEWIRRIQTQRTAQYEEPVPFRKSRKSVFGSSSQPTPPPPRPPSPPQMSTKDVMTLLRRSIQKWLNTLVSVSFKTNSATRFQLPADVFNDLVSHPDMNHLEIIGMGVDFIDGALHRIKEVEQSKIEVLHLPVRSTAIYPARLRDIAEACASLKSLRCQLCIRDDSDLVASSPLSHTLEDLSVSSEGGKLEQGQLLGVARYLDSIFPRMKSVTTHDQSNKEQWGFVFDLVKSYQAVRMDEQQRLGLGPEGGIGSTSSNAP